MLVIGIDPGSRRTGYGLVRRRGAALVHVASGVLAAEGTLPERLLVLADQLDALLGRHRPEAAAVESVFHHKSSASALKLGQARGALLLCLARARLDIFEYTPAEIKRAATGNGRADKETVMRMVRLILGHGGELALDASDALAAAICHTQVPARRAP